MTDAEGFEADLRRVANAVILVAVGVLNVGFATFSDNVWGQALSLFAGLIVLLIAVYSIWPVARGK